MKAQKSETKLDIKQVGVFFRNGFASDFVERMHGIFSRAQIQLRVLPNDSREEPAPDLVISLGGDGTVLHALSLYPECPVLPINFGHTGFLTAGNEEDAEKLIYRLLAGEYFVDERLRLTSQYQGQENGIVNEVIIKGTTRIISIEVTVDGLPIHTMRADGVIVGTPTGSTSYLLATGSAIVSPQVPCIIINGINEYRFASRSLIMPADSIVQLRINENTRENEIFISHDGRDKIMAKVGDELTVRRAEKPARLIFFDRHYFFHNLKSRLDW